MAITKIGGRQIDVDKSPLSSSNRDDSVLKDADGGLILTGNVRLLHAPSDDLDAATKAYVDATTGASIAAGFIAFGDSDGSGLEGTGDFMFYESGRDFVGTNTPLLAISGAIAIGRTEVQNQPGLLLNFGRGQADQAASGSISTAGRLVLSSSSGSIVFEDSGVEFFGIVEDNSGDVILSSSVSDKDMIFQVNDGGTATEVFRVDGDVSAILVASGKELRFADSGEAISGDGTDLTIKSGAQLLLSASSDVAIPVDIGLTFDQDEKIESDGTDLTINGGATLKLSASGDVALPSGIGLILDGNGDEKIESDGTDITIAVGSGGDINIGSDIGLTFGDDGEKIEGDGTNLTIAGNILMLSASNDVALPINVGLTFDNNEKIESNGTDLTVTSGGDIVLAPAASGDVNIGSDLGLTFGDDGEKIEGDGTNLTISSSALLILSATSDVAVAKGVGVTFDDNGSEKIESDNTDLTINSGNDINLTATADINIPASVGLTFGADTEKIEVDGSQNLTVSAGGNVNAVGAGDVTVNSSGGTVSLQQGGNAVITLTSDTATLGAGDTLAIPATSFLDAAAASQVSIAGIFAAGSATGYTIPNFVHNSFEYLSSSQTDGPFARIDGSSNVTVRQGPDSSAGIGGTSTKFVVSGANAFSSFVTSSVQLYLNGVRLTPATGSTHVADFAVTGGLASGGKNMMDIVLNSDLKLQTGDQVILDFRMQTNG